MNQGVADMMRKRVVGLAVVAFAALGAAAAHADTIFEVEHARANARAGRLVSEHDVELLQRYGATSGTPYWRHGETWSYGIDDDYDRPRARHHRRHHWR
jgi:hypothetical protein